MSFTLLLNCDLKFLSLTDVNFEEFGNKQQKKLKRQNEIEENKERESPLVAGKQDKIFGNKLGNKFKKIRDKSLHANERENDIQTRFILMIAQDFERETKRHLIVMIINACVDKLLSTYLFLAIFIGVLTLAITPDLKNVNSYEE